MRADLMDAFPGSEDYEKERDPVAELTLLEQIEYWKSRARLAEELVHKYRESFVLEAEKEPDAADWWKKS